jgi:hypothetical protein
MMMSSPPPASMTLLPPLPLSVWLSSPGAERFSIPLGRVSSPVPLKVTLSVPFVANVSSRSIGSRRVTSKPPVALVVAVRAKGRSCRRKVRLPN